MKFYVALEGNKWYEWLIPWHFITGKETGDGTVISKSHGWCWLWWTFYFKVI